MRDVAPEEILEAAESFLRVLDDGPMSPKEREDELRLSLHRLSVAARFLPPTEPSTDDSGETVRLGGYVELRKRLARLFSTLGYYPVAARDPTHEAAEELLSGDALDDLVDIAIDVHDVVRKWEALGQNDALFAFRLSFESHWGAHLRGLREFLANRK